MSASTLTPIPAAATKAAELPLLQRIVRTLLTQRVALLGVLIVVVLAYRPSRKAAHERAARSILPGRSSPEHGP